MRTLCACLAVAVTAAVVALSACGGSGLPDKPQIQPDKTELDWGSLYFPDAGQTGEAVLVGTSAIDTVSFQNKGTQDLTITSVAVTGKDSPLFTATAANTTVASRQWGSVQVTFSPNDEGSYTATLEIVTNAENTPTLDIPLIPVAQYLYVSKGIVETVANPVAGADAGVASPILGIHVDCMTGCTQGGADAGYATTCTPPAVWSVTTPADGTFRKASNSKCDAIEVSDPANKMYQTKIVAFEPNTNMTIIMSK